MASPSTVFTEMVTTTLRHHPTSISDNVSKHNAFYFWLQRKGKIRNISGGYEIVKPLDYQENQSFQRFSGYDTLNVQASDVLTAAKFEWVQSALHVTASGRELRQNSGKEQLIDLAESRVKNALRTAANNMSLDIYSDGTLPNQMGGLAHLVQDAGQGTVGAINSATFSFWRNKFRETDGADQVTKSTIKGEMNALYLDLVRGADKPDLIIMSHDYYAMYWESMQDLQRFMDADTAKAGFNTLKYVNSDVIFDSNTNYATTAQKAYFLNTDYLELYQHRDAKWTQIDDKISINQDAVLIPLLWQGQMCVSNRSLQGVLIDAEA